MPEKKVESYERLVEHVIFLTRRVHELEQRLGVPSDVIVKHAEGCYNDPLYFQGGALAGLARFLNARRVN